MNKALVTGAGGFIGRHAVAALATLGFEVHGVARRPADDVVAIWHEADLTDGEARRALIDAVRPSHLLHFAWETRHGYFWQAPENRIWTEATVDLAQAFRRAGGQRAVFAGSCAEYDWSASDRGVCREDATPCRPATAYGRAKQTTHERMAELELNFAWGRLFLLYGPFEAETRLAPSIIKAALAGRPAELKEPDAVRDFLDARDAGAAFASLLASSVEGPVNIASGEGVAVAHVAERLIHFADGPDAVSPHATTPDPARLIADVTRLRDEVGFTPARDIDQGLADAVDWWRNR